MTNENLRNFSQHLLCRPEIQLLFQNLSKCLDENQLTFDEMGCCLMYLNKIGLSIDNDMQQKIIRTYLKKLQITSLGSIPLTALSRFIVPVSTDNGIYSTFICLKLIPHIEQHLSNCSQTDDLRLITIALNHIAKLVPQNLLKKYSKKVTELIEGKHLNAETLKTNFKILNFLNYPEWADTYTKLSRDIVLLMETAIESLSARELSLIQKVSLELFC